MSIGDILISTVTGVLASFAVWWYTLKYLTPKIKFSNSISRLPTEHNDSGYRYRFKFENSGSRNIIDAEVIVRVRIKGLRKEMSGNWEVVYLPISSMEYQKLAIIRPVSRPFLDMRPLRPVFEIKGYACDYFENSLFSLAIRQKAAAKSLSLDDILSIGNDANLQVLLLAYDEFSGARKFFESPLFTKADIKNGYYEKNSVYMVLE
jgi:hypothetical protein